MNLESVPLLRGLEQQEIELVRSVVKERIYPKGTTIFVEGQETDGLYIVTSGLIKVFKLYKDGREKTLAILREGDIIGEVTISGSTIRSATVGAIEHTNILVISKTDLHELLRQIPGLSIRVIETLSHRLRQTNRQVEELTFLNARSRVICNLITLAKECGQTDKNGIKITLRLTHADLANLVGVTRETVTKVLSELQNSNLIQINNRQIRVLDIQKLYDEVT